MDLVEIAKLVASEQGSDQTTPSETTITDGSTHAVSAQPVAMKAILEQRIAAMRAEIKEKERATMITPDRQATTASTSSVTVSPASSVNFSILDKALATHGYETMPDSDEDDHDSSVTASSDASNSSSDSEDEADTSERLALTAAERERILIAADGDGEGSSTIPPRTKHELAEEEEPVVVPSEQVLPSDEIRLLGHVASQVGKTCVVAGIRPPSLDAGQGSHTPQSVLDIGSLLVLADRRNVGYIADTFGPVSAPLFAVRFAEAEQAAALNLSLGDEIYMVPRYAKYVFGDTLKVKGSDASNIHDEEVGGDEVEFSDDEQEAAYKKMLKEARRNHKGQNSERQQRPMSDLEAIAEQQGFSNGEQQRTSQPAYSGRGGNRGGRGGRGRGGASQQQASRDAPRQPYQRAFYTPDTPSLPPQAQQQQASSAEGGFQVYAPLKRPDVQ
ncbi:Gar1/Naf1 RNA binding region-domain-containing protein [Protomyces lactucae-debilis]|uniref:H/ACA ribonucleoprotein complex non-core subunit NAF1 n=1 Tax=Protomyces lactucae-debilis TaxID=2754530 RepID=A0A1Y2FN88_PROLT|nr:Gar1/Naf1 RNA binding region-domain-containing protein [Protomyces lactucae-debilis]ORY85461.1 Gar1/Naf1 RNA binding region-domain-containing protein [Protomyces lactucae-debilis]